MLSVIIWAILTLIVVFAVIAIVVKRKSGGKKAPEDYYTLFIIGVTWLPIGILMSFAGDVGLVNVFTLIGFIFLLTGLAHKNEWKKRKKLTEKQKKIKLWFVVALSLLLFIGIVVSALTG